MRCLDSRPGKVVEWIGYKRTMVAGLLTMAVGAILFIPAADLPLFPLFLLALIFLGAGMAALQVAANPYVAVLGPPETASSRLNLSQAFNSLGTTIGPPLGGFLILKGAEKLVENVNTLSPAALHAYRVQQAATVKFPYLVFTLVLILLSLAIGLYKFPRIDATKDYRPQSPVRSTPASGAIGMWCWERLEFLSTSARKVLDWQLPDQLFWAEGHCRAERAGRVLLSALLLGGRMIGRFIGSAVLQKVKTGKLLTLCATVAMILVLISMLSFGHVALWSILLVGLFNSIMFPSIFTLGIAEMGPLTGEASGLLVTAIVGGAIIPEIQGVLADHIGLHHAFILPVLCYIFIAYYGWKGSRVILPASSYAA